jgi:hypothetical protein
LDVPFTLTSIFSACSNGRDVVSQCCKYD